MTEIFHLYSSADYLYIYSTYFTKTFQSNSPNVAVSGKWEWENKSISGDNGQRPKPVKVLWTHTVNLKCKCADACYRVVTGNQQALYIQKHDQSQAQTV